MQKVKAEDYLKHTRQRETTPTYNPGAWEKVGYSPNESCPQCKGAGFVHPIFDGAIRYGEIIPCHAEGCLLSKVRGERSLIVQRQTFETFKDVKGTEKALKAATSLAYGEASFIWLLLYGRPGNGKTHLCHAMVSVLHDRGLEVRMILAADLFAALREGIKENRTDELLRGYKEIFFLIIDDYGVEYGSDWESSQFDQLMTSRYATARPTVLVTNKNLNDLPERIQSRFQDKDMSRAIYNSASDYRARA